MTRARLAAAALLALLAAAPAAAQGIGPDEQLRDALRWREHREAAEWISTGLVVAALVLPCARDRTWRCVGNEAVQVGVSVSIAEITKRVTHRTRPNGRDRLSFFSEHTMLACLAKDKITWALCPSVALLRVGGDDHWSSDVAVGAVVGLVIPRWRIW